MKPSLGLGLATVIALLAGLIFGLTPIRSDGYACGNAFKESSELEVAELRNTFSGGTGMSGCDEARSGRQPLVWTLLSVAFVLGLTTIMVRSSELYPNQNKPKTPAHPEEG